MFDKIVKHIEENDNFSFSRWGDGEWNCVLGKNGANCDGHTYFNDMGERLRLILQSKPSYYMGLQTLAESMYSSQINEYEIEWVESDCIHRANVRQRIQPFFDAINKRNVLLVGNITHKSVDVISYSEFIEVDRNNCWLQYEAIRDEIKRKMTPNMVILYCASMMSNVLIDDIFNEYGNTVTQVDCGSIFEPYVGLSTRSYHKQLIINLKK